MPFGIDNGLNCLIWVWLGNAIYRNIENPYLRITPFIVVWLLLFGNIPVLDVSTKVYGNVGINILWAVSFVTTLMISLRSICEYEKIPLFLKKILFSPVITQWGTNTMILFILHPYTNNIAYLLEYFMPDLWYGKFLISLLLLYIVLFFLKKFRYVRIVQLFYK